MKTQNQKLQIFCAPVRTAAKGGKADTVTTEVDGKKAVKRVNLRIMDWTLNPSEKFVTGSVDARLARSTENNVTTFTASKDMTIKKGQVVMVQCMTVHGASEVTRIQKDFVEAKLGVLSPEAELENARREIVAKCSKAIENMLEYFDGVQVHAAMVAKGEFSEEVITEAVANGVQRKADRDAKAQGVHKPTDQ